MKGKELGICRVAITLRGSGDEEKKLSEIEIAVERGDIEENGDKDLIFCLRNWDWVLVTRGMALFYM